MFRRMRVDRHLVFKALCVLDEAVDQANAGKVPPSFGLRFALAFLYAAGNRSGEHFDREPYDEFWRLATQRDEVSRGVNGGVDGYVRTTGMRTAVNGIARAAGLECTSDLMRAMRRARRAD